MNWGGRYEFFDSYHGPLNKEGWFSTEEYKYVNDLHEQERMDYLLATTAWMKNSCGWVFSWDKFWSMWHGPRIWNYPSAEEIHYAFQLYLAAKNKSRIQ